VSAFAPLVLGLFWKRATTAGALLSVVLGLVSWLLLEVTAPEALVPPQLVGLAFSVLGMLMGSLATRPAHAPAHHG
jgi:Na+/proline symporter